MPPVALRPKEPTNDTIASAGHVDTSRERLDAVSARDLGDDAYARDGRDVVVRAVNALEDARRLLWSTADRHVDRIAMAEGVIQSIGDERAAVAEGAMFPGDGTAGFAAARSAAQAKVRAGYAAQVTREVLALPAVQKQGAEVATAASDAMRALADYVASSADDYYGPRALSRNAGVFDVARVHRVGTLEHELRNEPPQSWRDRYERLMARGETDKLDLLDEALAPLIREVKDASDAQLVARFRVPGNMARKDAPSAARDVAFKLGNLMTERRRANEPPSLAALQWCAATLAGCFYELLGTYAPLMASPDFARRFLGDANAQDAAAPWGVEPEWVARRLPPAGSPPPGWSRIVGRTRLGAVIREPKGA